MSFDLIEKCEEYFGTRNIYEVLQVEPNATDKEIKKAYHRLSLMVHPDRVQESQKLIATEKFKVLCKIHSILQNPEKRSIYDESGDVDDDCELDDSWMNYWKSIFRKITKEDIKKCEDEYIGSETEIRDLKKAYVNGKGSMNFIIQNVPFSNCDHEPRYIEIIRKLVDDGEVDEYEEFFNEPLKKKMRRKKKEEKERAEAEEMPAEDFEKQYQENADRHERNFFDLIARMEEKYANKSKKRKSITGAKTTPNKKQRSKK